MSKKSRLTRVSDILPANAQTAVDEDDLPETEQIGEEEDIAENEDEQVEIINLTDDDAAEEEKEEEPEEIEVVEVVTPKVSTKQPTVRIKPNSDHNTYIGDKMYFLKKGVVQLVPQNVKEILNRAGFLSPL